MMKCNLSTVPRHEFGPRRRCVVVNNEGKTSPNTSQTSAFIAIRGRNYLLICRRKPHHASPTGTGGGAGSAPIRRHQLIRVHASLPDQDDLQGTGSKPRSNGPKFEREERRRCGESPNR